MIRIAFGGNHIFGSPHIDVHIPDILYTNHPNVSSLSRVWFMRMSEAESVITTAWVSQANHGDVMHAVCVIFLARENDLQCNDHWNFGCLPKWLCGAICIEFKSENSWSQKGLLLVENCHSLCNLRFHIARQFVMVWQPASAELNLCPRATKGSKIRQRTWHVQPLGPIKAHILVGSGWFIGLSFIGSLYTPQYIGYSIIPELPSILW